MLSKTLLSNLSTNLKFDISLVEDHKSYLTDLSKKLSILDESLNNDYRLNWNTYKLKNYEKTSQDFLIAYVITVSFLKTNTIVHLSDTKGNLKLFYSSGSIGIKGKQKLKRRRSVILRLISLLLQKATFLGKSPVALHLNNVNSYKKFVINKLKKKAYIKIIKSFNQFPYNGCRKKKIRRKKYSKIFK